MPNAALASPVASIAAPIVGGLLGSKSASKQAQVQQQGYDASTALNREQFEYLKQIMAPYQQVGAETLPALQSFVNQPQSNFSFDYNEYFKSPQFKALQQQQSEQALRMGSATGGFRGGDTQAALAAIAPQLAMQAEENARSNYSLNQGANINRYNQMMGLAQLGLGATGSVGDAAQVFGAQAGKNAALAADARATGIGERYNAIGGGLAGLFKKII